MVGNCGSVPTVITRTRKHLTCTGTLSGDTFRSHCPANFVLRLLLVAKHQSPTRNTLAAAETLYQSNVSPRAGPDSKGEDARDN